MRDYETLWHVLRNTTSVLVHQGNTPITPLTLDVMLDHFEQIDDLKSLNTDLQERVNELDAQLRLKESDK